MSSSHNISYLATWVDTFPRPVARNTSRVFRENTQTAISQTRRMLWRNAFCISFFAGTWDWWQHQKPSLRKTMPRSQKINANCGKKLRAYRVLEATVSLGPIVNGGNNGNDSMGATSWKKEKNYDDVSWPVILTPDPKFSTKKRRRRRKREVNCSPKLLIAATSVTVMSEKASKIAIPCRCLNGEIKKGIWGSFRQQDTEFFHFEEKGNLHISLKWRK